MDRLYPDAWIQTFTGKQFWLLEPNPEDVDIKDIAHALSLICRYGGHSRVFYSVAEHSILVGQKTGLHGLLHDAAEAYVGDMVRPLKYHFPLFREVENDILDAIYFKLGLILPTENEYLLVKEADNRVLSTEKLALHHEGHQWNLLEPYTDIDIKCFSSKYIEYLFLKEFERLYNG